MTRGKLLETARGYVDEAVAHDADDNLVAALYAVLTILDPTQEPKSGGDFVWAVRRACEGYTLVRRSVPLRALRAHRGNIEASPSHLRIEDMLATDWDIEP